MLLLIAIMFAGHILSNVRGGKDSKESVGDQLLGSNDRKKRGHRGDKKRRGPKRDRDEEGDDDGFDKV